MVWDLRGALLKKEEYESARLADFAFRHRARTFRLIAEALGLDTTQIVQLVARSPDPAALAYVSEQHGIPLTVLNDLYHRSSASARRTLIEERGDPSPHRLL